MGRVTITVTLSMRGSPHAGIHTQQQWFSGGFSPQHHRPVCLMCTSCVPRVYHALWGDPRSSCNYDYLKGLADVCPCVARVCSRVPRVTAGKTPIGMGFPLCLLSPLFHHSYTVSIMSCVLGPMGFPPHGVALCNLGGFPRMRGSTSQRPAPWGRWASDPVV
jgi:hypothetical protein